MTFGTVTATAPLEVVEDEASTALPAKVAGGLTVTLAVNDRVLLARVAGRVYVMGKA